MKYNIIGDIHGMKTWKKLVKKDYINIFVGDYFSPYPRMRKKEGVELPDGMEEDIANIGLSYEEEKKLSKWYEVYTPTFEDLKKNFLEIMKYKRQNPDNTILLIGNHDEDHWHIREEISRHDYCNCQSISDLFNKYKDYFTAAYNIEDKALVTHAGVTTFWYENIKDNISEYRNFDRIVIPDVKDGETVDKAHMRFLSSMFEENKWDAIIQWNDKLWRYDLSKDEYCELKPTVQEVCDVVNDTWKQGRYRYFDFEHNCDCGDHYGYSKQQGPMWVRDKTLVLNNVFMYQNIKQFVGHTQHEKLIYINNVGFVDSLQFNAQSIVYDTEEDKVYKNEGRKKLIELTDVRHK